MTDVFAVLIVMFASQQHKKSKYLVMGKRGGRAGEDLKPTFIVPWTKSKVRR